MLFNFCSYKKLEIYKIINKRRGYLEKHNIYKKSKYIIIKGIRSHKTFVWNGLSYTSVGSMLFTRNQIYRIMFEGLFQSLNVRERIYKKNTYLLSWATYLKLFEIARGLPYVFFVFV